MSKGSRNIKKKTVIGTDSTNPPFQLSVTSWISGSFGDGSVISLSTVVFPVGVSRCANIVSTTSDFLFVGLSKLVHVVVIFVWLDYLL